MNARAQILNRLKNSIEQKNGGSTHKPQRLVIATKRIASHKHGIIPDRTNSNRRSSMTLFCQKVIASKASIKKVKKYASVSSSISSYLRDNNLPQRIRMGDDKRLTKLGWKNNKTLKLYYGSSDGSDIVSVSHAMGGVSETGTLLLTSGSNNPSTLNFLPEVHIIIVHKSDIKKSYEELWKTLRRKYGKGKMPRTVNMITGPSRSADIEQTLILGAHGPQRVHVIVVDEGK